MQNINQYLKLDHGVSSATPVILKHDIWENPGRGQFDMHYEIELGIVCTGNMIRKHGNWKHLFSAGDIWCNSIWEPHGTEIVDAPVELLMFHIYPPMLAQLHFPELNQINWMNLFTKPIEKRVNSLTKNPELPLKVARNAMDLIKKQQKTESVFYNLKVRQMMMEILIAMAEENVSEINFKYTNYSDYQTINKAIDLVFNSHTLVTFAEAVKVSGINRTHFARNFKNFMGMSFAKFALRYRLGGAAEDLLYSTLTIKEIAGKWDFTDSSHFHRHFTQNYNTTPDLYRKTHNCYSQRARGSAQA
jgi:AraC-like DNA-binding protein